MALDATPGTANTNAYLTVAEADALVAEQGLGRAPVSWHGAQLDQKEKALIRATREIDAYLERAGRPYSVSQVLLFPRLTDYDDELALSYIPQAVRLATFEQALYVLHNADQIDDANTRRARALSQFADADGSGSLAPPEPGVMSAQARWYLRHLKGTGRATLWSIPVQSSYAR